MPGLRQASGFAVVVGFTVLAIVVGVFLVFLRGGLGLRFPAAGVDLLLFFLGDRAGVFPLRRSSARQCRDRGQPQTG